jgi:biopolymer transport protein ExbD
MSGGGGDSEYEVGINLTALLDVLTNLLFFLLFGYAAQQHSVESEGLTLPESSAEFEPKQDVKLMLSKKEIRVDGKVVARIKNGDVDGDTDAEGKVDPLYKTLVAKRDRAGNKPDGNVLFVLCDKDMPYKALRKVMTTAAQAGYAKYRLGALMQ